MQACKILELNFRRTILRRWPVGTRVNASCRTSRCTTHDSGTVWFAIRFLFGTFTFYSLSVSALAFYLSLINFGQMQGGRGDRAARRRLAGIRLILILLAIPALKTIL